MKTFAKNNINCKLSIDLHGLTVPQALINTATIILECYKNNIKFVLIIHGKGKGILRNKIEEFLKLNKLIANFSIAPQKMGGDGAIIAQIKNQIKNFPNYSKKK